MTLRRRLLAAQVPLLLALAAFAAATMRGIGEIGSRAERILQENYRSVLALHRMRDAAERIDRSTLVAAAGRDVGGDAAVESSIREFEVELAVQEANLTEVGEREATAELRRVWTECVERALRSRDLAPGALRIADHASHVGPACAAVVAAADRVLAMNQDAMVRKSDEAARSARVVAWRLVAAAIAAGMAGAGLSAWLTARALRPLSAVQSAARRIGAGDLSARSGVAGEDEIAQLGAEIDTMAARLHAYRASTLGELIEARAALRGAIDSLPDPVLVLGPSGDIRIANVAAERILASELLRGGRPSVSLLPDPVRDAVERLRDEVLAPGGPARVGAESSVRLDLPDGPRRFLPRATPVRAAEGDVVAATVVLQDVTRLVRSEEMKDDLVATVAHEFRTPLTSLRMAVHLCIEGVAGPTTEKQQEILHAARDDCERLQRLVDDLLDLSRLRDGKSALTTAACSAESLVESALDAVRAAADLRSVTVAAAVSPEAGDVLADRERAVVVLVNLVSNAVRHAPEGSTVVVAALRQPDGVRFEVEDGGAGVPPEHRASVFDRGFQVPGGRGGSAGLGLWIARELVRAHGGSIGVEAPSRTGCRFWFTLPAAAPARAP